MFIYYIFIYNILYIIIYYRFILFFRFFSDSDPHEISSNEPKLSNPEPPTELDDSRPTDTQTLTPPRRLGSGVFGWSGNRAGGSGGSGTPSSSGLSDLQHFQRKKEGVSWERRDSPEAGVDVETPPTSPPSQDSAYFSQNNTTTVEGGDSPGQHLSQVRIIQGSLTRSPYASRLIIRCSGEAGHSLV